MRLLGAIFAGGTSRRFGGDKALATLHGKPLIQHVIDRLAPQVETLVVCGRDWPPYPDLADRPAPGLGPLGALCAALDHAAAHRFDAVLTSGCDLPYLPEDLAERLSGDGARVAAGQPLLGFWPVKLVRRLEMHLAAGEDRRMSTWLTIAAARTIDLGLIINVNRREDLAALE
ncbi:molybdenum cofactor guanylyltransferase [Polymorphobacter arshaanensis]|nr:molybdenum cofactor guanylyltransferase [Polymorphobacter arshaanensis]